MQPDEPNEEERLEQLPQDGQTPFQPEQPANDLPSDHPTTDTDIDSTELYNDGVSGATGVSDDSAQQAVGDYNPIDPSAEENAL